MHFRSSQFCLIIVWAFLQASMRVLDFHIPVNFWYSSTTLHHIFLTVRFASIFLRQFDRIIKLFVQSTSQVWCFNAPNSRLVHRDAEFFGKFSCRILNAIFHGISCHFFTNLGRIIIVIPTFTLCATEELSYKTCSTFLLALSKAGLSVFGSNDDFDADVFIRNLYIVPF